MVFAIAGLKIQFKQSPGNLSLFPQLQNFLSDAAEPDASIETHFFGETPYNLPFFLGQLPEKQEIFRRALIESGLTHLVENDSGCAFFDAKVTLFDEKQSVMRVFYFQKPRDYNIKFVLQQLLIQLCPIRQGLFVHGAGGLIDNKAFLIPGVSGAGKSTALAMFRHDRLLSDDMTVMRLTGEMPFLHATPVGPASDGPACGSLKVVFFPVKNDSFCLKPVKKLEAIELFFKSQAGFVEKVMKPFRKSYFEAVVKMFSQTRAYEMHFTESHIDNEAITGAILTAA